MTELTGSIDRIDWLSHDGVNIGMINDVLRNRFYDEILREHAPGRQCIDIGFGTGLLSMLALRHGAQHITAFESDGNRYELGQAIIQRLGLEHKITLHHERFNHHMLEQYPRHLVYTETVNGTLFQEGLVDSLPRSPRTDILPSTYLLHLHCFPVSWDLAQGMSQAVPELRPFSPGVDVDPQFQDLVNEFYHRSVPEAGHRGESPPMAPGVHEFPYQIHTAWGWSPYLEIARGERRAWSGYEISAQQCEITQWSGDQITTGPMDLDQPHLRWRVDLPESDTPICVAPRAGMQSGRHVMMLDRGHWGPMPRPVLCWGVRTVEITHDLRSGDISYQPVG